jgi:hemerythrin-like metal-binding protein
MNMTIEAQMVSDFGYFEVGFEPMDAIHREFHDLLAALHQAGDEGEKLLALHEHLLRHCSQEERWMRDTSFPARAAHEREHEMLLEVVAEVRRRFDAGDSEVVTRLAQELPHWFELHANSMDAALAVHLRNLDTASGSDATGAPREAATA